MRVNCEECYYCLENDPDHGDTYHRVCYSPHLADVVDPVYYPESCGFEPCQGVRAMKFACKIEGRWFVKDVPGSTPKSRAVDLTKQFQTPPPKS